MISLNIYPFSSFFHRCRDKYIDVVLTKDIEDFMERLSSQTNRSCWMGLTPYWIASIFCMTWYYRWLLRFQTRKVNFTIVKKVYLTPSLPAKKNQIRSHSQDQGSHFNSQAPHDQKGCKNVGMDQFSPMPVDNFPIVDPSVT